MTLLNIVAQALIFESQVTTTPCQHYFRFGRFIRLLNIYGKDRADVIIIA